MEKNLLIFSFLSVVFSTQASTIYVQFDKDEGDLLELHEWKENGASDKFNMITAASASSYCTGEEHLEECALDQSVTFEAGDVIGSEAEAFNGDIRFFVYISLIGKNTTAAEKTMLPKSALINILTENRDQYEMELANDDAGYNITLMFVDETRVAPPIDYTTNYIMVLVSILILVSACILALVLKCKESMDDKKRLQQHEGNRGGAQSTNDGTEHVTLTTIKSPDGDSKDASEGPVKV